MCPPLIFFPIISLRTKRKGRFHEHETMKILKCAGDFGKDRSPMNFYHLSSGHKQIKASIARYLIYIM